MRGDLIPREARRRGSAGREHHTQVNTLVSILSASSRALRRHWLLLERVSALKWRRRILIVTTSTLLLTIGLAGSADATFVSSKCETRGGGTQGNRYVDICVRLESYTDSNGFARVRGYGAMDFRGTSPDLTLLEIVALHVRAYRPPDGPQSGYIAADRIRGYDYINQRTGGYYHTCGYGFKAVMTYRIYWQSGTITYRDNFYTPAGRWEPPGC
jgi:hypothetical protein